MKINPVANSNLRFNANKKQSNPAQKEYSKGSLLGMSSIAVASTYLGAISNVEKMVPSNTKKTMKDYFTKENLKAFGKHGLNIAIGSLLLASVADFLHKDRQDAMDTLALLPMRD